MTRNPNRFFVYVLLDTRKPGKFIYKNDKNTYEFNEFEPFYIGMGSTPDRPKAHFTESSLKNSVNILKSTTIMNIIKETGNKPKIIRFRENLTVEDVISLEITMIEVIGKIKDNIGPLTNIQNGGNSGNLNIPSSLELCNILRDKHQGKNKSSNAIENMKNSSTKYIYKLISPKKEKYIVDNLKKFCIEHQLKYSNILSVSCGKSHTSNGWSAKLFIKNTVKKDRYNYNYHYELQYITGEIYTTNNLNMFSKEFNLNSACLVKIASGKNLSHMGFTVKKIDFLPINKLTNYYNNYIYNYYIYLRNGKQIKGEDLKKICNNYNFIYKNIHVSLKKKLILTDMIGFRIKKIDDSFENRNIHIQEIKSLIKNTNKMYIYTFKKNSNITKILSSEIKQFCIDNNINYPALNYHTRHKDNFIFKGFTISKKYIYNNFLKDDSLFINPEEV